MANPDSDYHKYKETFKKSRAKWLTTEKGKLYLKRNRHRYKTSEKGRLVGRKSRKRYAERYPEKIKMNNAKYSNYPRTRYLNYRQSAKQKNIAFSLTEEEFMSMWNRPCHYCGNDINGIGIDRVDTTHGYHISNAVSCCPDCNYAKRKQTKEAFIAMCKRIVAIHCQ